jgi:hypothetical protein
MSVDKNQHFLTTYPPPLVNVVCEQPLKVKQQSISQFIILFFLGMGDRNPMHNVPFYNKEAEYVDFSDSTTICKRLSPDLLVETYYVVSLFFHFSRVS